MNDLSSPTNSTSSRWSLNRWMVIVSLLINGLIILGFALWRISFSPPENRPLEPAPIAEHITTPEPEEEWEEDPEVKPLPGETAPETVHRIMDEQIQSAQNRTDEENLEFIEKQGERLNRLSSEESIEQLTPYFQNWTQTEQRAVQPAQDTPLQTEESASSQNFDANTAQFHDVTKHKTKSGKIEYKAILLDAQGRTLLMELPPEDGERIYNLFVQMKKYPLLEKIYRQMVIPLLDKQLNKSSNDKQND